MRRWWRGILLFAVVYLLALLATLPAAQALHWAEPLLAKMAQRPQLVGVSGTVWSGQAAQLLYRGVAVGEVKWDVAVWRLALGKVDADLELLRDDGHLTARALWAPASDRVQLEDVEGALPAAVLKEWLPALPVAATGSFALALPRAELSSTQLHALEGRLVWNRAGLSSPFALEMGDLAAQFETRPEGVVAEVRDGGGPLQLEAQLRLAPDRSYTVSGKAQARSGANPALATSLSLLGQADDQGRVPFSFSGRL